ncbi:type II toxin-antitoxin system RelE/ParE family toxin [Candidatus Thiosymbion oneisti]|nr:type II toxin-antitoxin system RelE/ParE family toxin [Candidatus Thiosymbion oneisti]
MHTLVETPVFIRRAAQAGVSEAELDEIRLLIANHPKAGDPVPGTGGARKLRFAARGKGKSGGYRIITFFSGEDIPVFLLDIYAKGEKIDLSQNEKNTLRGVLQRLAETYRSKQDE